MAYRELTDQELEELTGGGPCHMHFHEPHVSRDNLDQLNSIKKIVKVSDNYHAALDDDIIVADTTDRSLTVTLPASRDGKEYTVVKFVAINTVSVDFGASTFVGLTGVTLSDQGAVGRYKSYSSNWIPI